MISETPATDDSSTFENEFAALLEEYDFEEPYRGQILEGMVLEVNNDEIIIDVGLKQDAIVTRKDLSLLDDAQRAKIQTGQNILAYVLQPRNSDGELIVSINKAMELEDWESAQKLMETGDLVTAIVMDANKGGLLVRYGRLNGFVPQSHVISLPRFASDYELQQAKQGIVGQELQLKFIEIDRKRNRLILSEREARAEAQQSRMAELEIGQQVVGKVVSIVNFGAFVDLGGVDGLIHISKLSHQHVNHPGEVLAIGDEVEVIVDDIDSNKNRISLNRVALLPDPWKTVETEYAVGDLVEGKVTNVVDFGVFVQLPNTLQGLVHVSKMSMFGSSNPHDLLREGDEVLVRIISIEADRQRIGLSIDDVAVEEQEEWLHGRREEAQQARAEGDDSAADSTAPIYNQLATNTADAEDATEDGEVETEAEADIVEADAAEDGEAAADIVEAEATEEDAPEAVAAEETEEAEEVID